MSSQRFVAGVPMKIWFWLGLFMCFGLAASFKCYICENKEKCAKPEYKDCDSAAANVCYSQKVDGKVDNLGCTGGLQKNTDHCEPPQDISGGGKLERCFCFKEGCNGNGAELKLGSNLVWIGLACAYTAVFFY